MALHVIAGGGASLQDRIAINPSLVREVVGAMVFEPRRAH